MGEDETGKRMFSALAGLSIQSNLVSAEFQGKLTKYSIKKLTTSWETPQRLPFRQNRCHRKVSFTEKAPRKVGEEEGGRETVMECHLLNK